MLNAFLTFGWVLINHDVWVWQPPYEQKNPIDEFPGQFLFFHVYGDYLLIPLPKDSSHSQNISLAFSTYYLLKTFLIITAPFSCNYPSHFYYSSMKKPLILSCSLFMKWFLIFDIKDLYIILYL